jgi:hypothetical protein
VVVENAKPEPAHEAAFIDMTVSWKTTPDPNQIDRLLTAKIKQTQFLQHRGNAFNYRCPPALLTLRAQAQKLEEIADIRQGLATSDNQRFIKWWWQVPPALLNGRYVPYVKGAGSERWYSPVETVIDWDNDGAEIKSAVAEAYPYLGGKTAWVVKNERYYFRKGLTFSLVNTRLLSVRDLPPGCIFDVAGSAVFAAAQDERWLLAYLNSSLVAACADVLNPTINYQVGDLKQLPLLPFAVEEQEELAALAGECLTLKRQLFNFHDGNMDAVPRVQRSTIDALHSAGQKLQANELRVDELVLQVLRKHYKFNREAFKPVEELCRRAAERRKAMALPFEGEQEFAHTVLRLMLYEIASQSEQVPLTAAVLKKRLGSEYAWIEQASGGNIMRYVQERFVADQLKHLHNTQRVLVESTGSDSVRLSSPCEFSRSRS